MNTEGDMAPGWLGTSSRVAVLVVSQLPIYSIMLSPTIQRPLEAAAGKQRPKIQKGRKIPQAHPQPVAWSRVLPAATRSGQGQWCDLMGGMTMLSWR